MWLRRPPPRCAAATRSSTRPAAPAPKPAGWFPAAALLGAFGKESQGNSVPAAAVAAAKAWAAGIPTGLVFRAISRGYVPPTPFIIVSLVRPGRLRWAGRCAAPPPAAGLRAVWSLVLSARSWC
jgi:hypothetical protein